MPWEGLGRDRPTSGPAVVWVARTSHRRVSPPRSPFPPPACVRGVDQRSGTGGDWDLPLHFLLASSPATRAGAWGPWAREARSERPGPTWARRWAP